MSRSRSLQLATSAAGAAAALAAAAVVLSSPASAAGAAMGVASGAQCRTGALSGRFAVVPGSAGAGNIVYALQVRNWSRHGCSVSGLPRLQLLDAKGRALPTHVVPAFGGAGAAVLVNLSPAASAWASARFTPDVAGPGEQTRGQCEPTAARVRVTVGPGAASFVAPVVPATPVCVSGRLTVSLLSRVKPTA